MRIGEQRQKERFRNNRYSESFKIRVVKAKQPDTSESWIAAVIFVMNIAHYLRVIFLSQIRNIQN